MVIENIFAVLGNQLFDPSWLAMIAPDQVGVPAMSFQAPKAGFHDAARREWQEPWPFLAYFIFGSLSNVQPMF